MTGILITEIEMPKDNPLSLTILPDGTIAGNDMSVAVAITPDMDLIDRNAIRPMAKKIQDEDGGFFIDAMDWGEAVINAIDRMPSVMGPVE